MVSVVSKQEFQFMVNSWPEYSTIEAAGKRSDQKNEQINNIKKRKFYSNKNWLNKKQEKPVQQDKEFLEQRGLIE